MPRDAGACIQPAVHDVQRSWRGADWEGRGELDEGYLEMGF